MTQVFDLDACEDDGVDIELFIPGPPGPPIVDVGTFLAPVVITDTIAAPVNGRQRSFIQSVTPLDQPIIPNPVDNRPWELYLFCVGGAPITINNASNIKLSGQCILSPDSILYLQWDGNSRYVEGGRNEI